MRFIKNYPQNEKKIIIKEIIKNFKPIDEETKNKLFHIQNPNIIISVIKSNIFSHVDFSEEILMVINNYKSKEDNYDHIEILEDCYEYYINKNSNLEDYKKEIIRQLICLNHIYYSVSLIEKIIQDNKENKAEVLLFTKNFCFEKLPFIYEYLFSDSSLTFSRIEDSEVKSIFEKVIILESTNVLNEDSKVKKIKRL